MDLKPSQNSIPDQNPMRGNSRFDWLLLALIAIAALSACSQIGAGAKTVHLKSDGTGDYPTLEAAVTDLEPGATIILEEGNFELASTLIITKTLTLQGAGVDLTTVSKAAQGLVVAVSESDHLTIKDMAFERTGEFAADVMIVLGGKISLENCRFSGGVGNQSGSVSGHGLGLLNASTATITNCLFEKNTGGGLVVFGESNAAVDGITSTNNRTGISFSDQTTGTIENSLISNNQIGVRISQSAEVSIVQNTISANGDGIIFNLDADTGEARRNDLFSNGMLGTDIVISGEFAPALIGNTCDGKGESELGADINGIVFNSESVHPANPILEDNDCQVAYCLFEDQFNLSCEY